VSTPNRKPRGVHPYTDGRGQRCYRIEYVGTDGKRHFKRLGPVPLKQAVEERENLKVAIRRGELVVTGDSLTFAQVRQEYEAARTIRRRTAETRDAHLRRYCQQFENRRVTDIGKADVLGWLGQLRSVKTGGALSEGTKAQLLAAFSAVLAHAVDVGYIARNPCRDLSCNQRPRQGDGRRRILTHDEEARLLAYCGSRPWLRPVIVVSLNQALRLGEAAWLQRADVDFANDKLRVHRQLSREGTLEPTKGASRNRRDRRDTHPIDLLPASREALLELFTDDLAETGFVFRCRRTSDFAGHTSLSTTETYVHKIESAETTAAAALAMAGTSLAHETGNGED
jgi:integrase